MDATDKYEKLQEIEIDFAFGAIDKEEYDYKTSLFKIDLEKVNPSALKNCKTESAELRKMREGIKKNKMTTRQQSNFKQSEDVVG